MGTYASRSAWEAPSPTAASVYQEPEPLGASSMIAPAGCIWPLGSHPGRGGYRRFGSTGRGIIWLQNGSIKGSQGQLAYGHNLVYLAVIAATDIIGVAEYKSSSPGFICTGKSPRVRFAAEHIHRW